MNQFFSDLRAVIFIFGIFWGIRTLFKEYRENKIKVNKKCFLFFALGVIFFEIVIVVCLVTLCSNLLFDIKNIMSYAMFSWALSSFCYSGYMFSGTSSNNDESKMERFRGKVAIFCGLYFLLITVISYEM